MVQITEGYVVLYNTNKIIVFEANPEILEQMGKQFEKDLFGYNFQIDTYAIRHIFNEHTDAKKEESRGQIVINESDILLVLTF